MSEDQRSEHRVWIEAALAEARDGVASGGMPFGAVLVIGGQIVARGHNRQIQDRRFLAHAEMVCLESFLAGHDGPLENATLVATEAPCPMCAGAAIVAGVSRFVVGEAHHYAGACDWLAAQNVDLTVMNEPGCIALVTDFRSQHADRWNRFSAG